MSQHAVVATTTSVPVDVDEVARRVASIHAELWLAGDAERDARAALVVACDALDDLLHDIGHADGVATALAEVWSLAASQVTGRIDLRDGVDIEGAGPVDVRRGRARVEAQLSDLLFALLGLPTATR